MKKIEKNFNWYSFLLENSLTQIGLAQKINKNKDLISQYASKDYISIKLKAHIEDVLNISLNKYLIKG